MSRLVRNRNRAEYLGAGIDAIEVEPRQTPMADARACAAAFEWVHAGDVRRADLEPVLILSVPLIEAAAVRDELDVES